MNDAFRGRWVSSLLRANSVRYYLALRKAFHRCSVLSITLDGTTLGNKKTVAAVVLAYTNEEDGWQAGWVPTQDTPLDEGI